jgi:FkbM family methyltransferase
MHSLSNHYRAQFFVALTAELMSDMSNWYGAENWDADRFGPLQRSLKSSLITKFNKWFSAKAAFVPSFAGPQELESLRRIEPHLEALSSLYALLADEYSRSTLVRVLAYRLLGYRRVKLPLNTSQYWSQRGSIRALIKSDETLSVTFPSLVLNHLDLHQLGYPIELYFAPMGVMATFILKQYEYGKRKPAIKAEAGDYVIDGGGGWGDTALYFAERVGKGGKVFTFEFVPENLAILQRNRDLNPQLSSTIELVRKALWECTGAKVAFSPHGPGTSLMRDCGNNGHQNTQEVTTTSIDDFVRERNLPRVDFLKMDIEGAELGALKGAEKTLRSFKPKLAISLYHQDEDFVSIPAYLDRLGIGYTFYLDHFTTYGEETILFATTAGS